jgi:hypothetical protein
MARFHGRRQPAVPDADRRDYRTSFSDIVRDRVRSGSGWRASAYHGHSALALTTGRVLARGCRNRRYGALRIHPLPGSVLTMASVEERRFGDAPTEGPWPFS